MTELELEIIVGILGQWASGKSTAAKTPISYLGGEGDVVFLTDFVCFSGQAARASMRISEQTQGLLDAVWDQLTKI